MTFDEAQPSSLIGCITQIDFLASVFGIPVADRDKWHALAARHGQIEKVKHSRKQEYYYTDATLSWIADCMAAGGDACADHCDRDT